MARPYWSGNVQISLVAFGVSLYVATESKGQISFHQISRRTGERIRHQKVLESAAESKEATTAVENDEIVKGYEYSKGKYVIIEPSELENLRIPSKHTIAVSQFVDVADLNPEYVEKPYFVTPENDMSSEAFNVVRQALVKTGKAAIGKVSFSGRENVIALVPAGPDSPGMMAYTLRYQNELRNRADYFRDIKQPAIDADSRGKNAGSKRVGLDCQPCNAGCRRWKLDTNSSDLGCRGQALAPNRCELACRALETAARSPEPPGAWAAEAACCKSR